MRLHDKVEHFHLMLMAAETVEYRRLLSAVWDAEAVEGSLIADDMMAARMIREAALRMGDDEVANKQLAKVSRSLGVVLRRYGMDRKTRRRNIGNVIYAGPPAD